jgi:hypothetical protein
MRACARADAWRWYGMRPNGVGVDVDDEKTAPKVFAEA